MLPDEHCKVVIAHIRHSMMSKAMHVSYATDKCFLLRENLIRSATQCREDAALLSPVQNRQYSLMNNIRRAEGEKKEQSQERRRLMLLREQYRLTGAMQQQLDDTAAGLMRSADALLFTLLKAQHYQWRDQLYMAVLTGGSDSVLPAERDCPLGQWLYGEGKRRFRALPGYSALQECHYDIHQATPGLSGRGPAEMSPRVLSETLQRVEDLSQRLIAALESLDTWVGLLYPEEVTGQ